MIQKHLFMTKGYYYHIEYLHRQILVILSDSYDREWSVQSVRYEGREISGLVSLRGVEASINWAIHTKNIK